MKNALMILVIFCYTGIKIQPASAQSTSLKPFNTLTFFYIDNSEGYSSDALNASINQEVGEEFKKKLSSVANKPDNYFYLLASDGDNVKPSSNITSLLESEWPKKYLARTSREADYNIERQTFRENFTNYPIRIKKEADVHIFLSAFALSQLEKKLDELPVPLFFPKELPLYLNNDKLTVNIFLYTNRATVEKMGVEKIKSLFDFCNPQLNLEDTGMEIISF